MFHAMFYAQMAETADSIELPDCDYASLLEMFRHYHSDKANLSGSNVMQVLYLANKYIFFLNLMTHALLILQILTVQYLHYSLRTYFH